MIVEHVASIDERTYLADLVARKRDTPEKGEIILERNRREAISAELEDYGQDITSSETSPKASSHQLDATLLRWIDGAVPRSPNMQ